MGVRAISFLIVFIAHAGLDWIVPGRFGVNIFFLLSGYLITTLMVREHASAGWISLKLFYARRSLRIFSAHVRDSLRHPALPLVDASTGGHYGRGGLSSQLFYYQKLLVSRGLDSRIRATFGLWQSKSIFTFSFRRLMLLLLDRLRMNYAQIARTLLCLCLVILVLALFSWLPICQRGLRWARDQSDTRADSILFGCVLACLEQTRFCENHIHAADDWKDLFYLLVSCCFSLPSPYGDPVFRENISLHVTGRGLSHPFFITWCICLTRFAADS